jgi:guanosine-3',5'-bis(diphosphate) 3'-pyrophosphohydrolase
MTGQPDFVTQSALLSSAYELARSAHHGPARRGDTDIEHPLAVAEILNEHGFDEQIVAAALLHDVVEDTALDLAAVAEPFGPEISRLVEEMTEDAGIEPYPERKAEHRARVNRDPRAAAIYAADKLASARALSGHAGEVSRERLDHYTETLRMLCESHPELPFLAELRDRLDALQAERDRG